MDKRLPDQAERQRRVLEECGARVVAVTGGSSRVGRTSTVVNLAAALAAQGKDVLVIDECVGGHSVSAMLGGARGLDGAGSAGNFSAVLNGELPVDQAAVRTGLGFALLAAPRHHCDRYSATQLGAMLGGPADVVLIDAPLDRLGALSALAVQAHDVMIVTRLAAQAIADAYVCMKRLHRAHAIAQFRVLVNHVESRVDAQVVFESLAGVAARYLTVSATGAGCVAADPRMARSLELGRCVVDAFPSTPAARDYRHVAAEMLYWPMRPAMWSRQPAVAPAAVSAVPHADKPSAQSR
ncbi:MinD/ParA family ATP-binding protein [Paraburkholderia dilworthii]|uniref:MinD/ParA family ATP-binding protein n=1 Tax=Paraburkholderia dilworthii TaxID=948106 RepID=UPI00041A0CA1|nr:flagellar biosynthesis protein FlhG [Paraburkholderia dilworthii]